jgi:hypothetical protein
MFSGNPQGPTSREEANERKYSGPRMFPTCEIVGEVVLCGDKETLERLKNSKAAARPEFADALAAASDTAAQVIFAPTADQRRVLAEMLPQLPEDLGGGSGKAPANGLIWAVVGLQTQPKLSARLIIQSKDAESAAQFERFIAAAGRTADRMLDKKDKPAEFAKLVELFTPKAQGSRLTLELSEENQALVKVKSLLATVAVGARKPAQRSQCANNLKQLALAMYNFHDAYGSFPPSASYDGKSKKLLSWRVHLLPFVEAQALYEQFHLDEPWDSEHNKKLIPKMPPVFACPSAKTREKGMTTYLAPLGEKTIFSGKAGVALKEITDGTSNTIMLVDVAPDRAVIWTKPDDLEVDFDNPLKGLETHHDGGFQSAFCDGAVRFISPSIGPEKLRLLLMRNDGKPVGAF